MSRLAALGVCLLLSVALLAAACGGGDDSSKTAPPTGSTATQPAASNATKASVSNPTPAPASPTAAAKSPCSYLTKAEIESNTGKTLTNDGTVVNPFSCSYPTTDGGTVNIGVASPVNKTTWENQVKANAGAVQLTPISGLGDEAFAVSYGVSAIKGTTSLSVAVFPTKDATGGDAAIALMKLLLQRV